MIDLTQNYHEMWASHGEELSERLEGYLSKVERTDAEQLPDLYSAVDLLNKMRDTRYTEYLFEFSLKHPVMWLLFYRWWFLFSTPKELRKYIPRLIRLKKPYNLSWPTFAMHHPVLFFAWLLLYTPFQFFVKALTAPIKIIRISHNDTGFAVDSDKIGG